jgi:hypothetical protein
MAGFVMGMMQVMHPKMGPGNELSAPGLFAKNINPMTPGGADHAVLVYGAIVASIYSA